MLRNVAFLSIICNTLKAFIYAGLQEFVADVAHYLLT